MLMLSLDEVKLVKVHKALQDTVQLLEKNKLILLKLYRCSNNDNDNNDNNDNNNWWVYYETDHSQDHL